MIYVITSLLALIAFFLFVSIGTLGRIAEQLTNLNAILYQVYFPPDDKTP
jgi:hypothetical protein